MARAYQRYHLCAGCLEREGGQKTFDLAQDNQCFICNGLVSSLSGFAEKAAKAMRKYEFKTFSMGVILPEGVQEREDELRSETKIKGGETIKVQVSKFLTSATSALTRKTVDKSRPDLLAVVDFGRSAVSVTTKPLYFFARYAKPPGVGQRRLRCRECRGRGCPACSMTGFDRVPSVEEAVARRLAKDSRAVDVRFMWIGSEDASSRVYPPGRPFVAEIKSPGVRRIPRRFVLRGRKWQVSVTTGRVLPSKPTRLPSFRFRTLIAARAKDRVSREELGELKKAFRKTSVRFDRPGNRPVLKMVYSATAIAKGRDITLDAQLDGGLPVKRFVSGELVTPSVSEVLKTEVECRRFDICNVKLTGEFGFA